MPRVFRISEAEAGLTTCTKPFLWLLPIRDLGLRSPFFALLEWHFCISLALFSGNFSSCSALIALEKSNGLGVGLQAFSCGPSPVEWSFRASPIPLRHSQTMHAC